jgi:hypothetical protein
MHHRIRFSPAAVALVAVLATACSEAANGPTATGGSFTPTPSFSGGSGGGTSGGGSGGGGGGSTALLPQVAGIWNGQEHYDPGLSVFFLPAFMNPPVSFTFIEDAAGNITGVDNRMGIAITGKASSNGTIVIQDGAYYGQKLTMGLTGSVTCSDGSAGTVMSGKFQRKEGFGTVSMDNCPVAAL